MSTSREVGRVLPFGGIYKGAPIPPETRSSGLRFRAGQTPNGELGFPVDLTNARLEKKIREAGLANVVLSNGAMQKLIQISRRHSQIIAGYPDNTESRLVVRKKLPNNPHSLLKWAIGECVSSDSDGLELPGNSESVRRYGHRSNPLALDAPLIDRFETWLKSKHTIDAYDAVGLSLRNVAADQIARGMSALSPEQVDGLLDQQPVQDQSEHSATVLHGPWAVSAPDKLV
jgi:hypothetical protein